MGGRYRAGLVGCGRVGALWDLDNDSPAPLTHAGALSLLPQVRLVAGASRGRLHLEAFGQRWGVDALYNDYREMLARERLDIVAVATHPGLHRDIVEHAVRAGVRAIFCEKPLALALEDADAMVAACRPAGCVLSVNHSRRWHPAYQKARELLQAGAIGELISMSGVCQGCKPHPSWQSDEEGPLLHDAVHLFDLFRMFGGEATAAIGTARRRRLPYPVEDDSQVIFEFGSGIAAAALVNELTRYTRFELELQGADGLIRLSDAEQRLWTSVRLPGHRSEPDPTLEWWRLEPVAFPAYRPASPILDAIRELVACLETGAKPSSSGEDGVASLEMCMAAYESQARDNARVTLPLDDRRSQLQALRRKRNPPLRRDPTQTGCDMPPTLLSANLQPVLGKRCEPEIGSG
jgi:predicted dehydrogenase